jgi:hypothetical protein
MAKPNSKTKAPAREPADPLASPSGRAWLAAELTRAEAIEAEGPGGSWKHNESLAPEIVERAAFLRALIAKLD